MKTNRRIAAALALTVVVALVGLAVAAGRDSGSKTPATLPVLGAGGAAKLAAGATSDMRLMRPVRYEARGSLPTLDTEADAYVLGTDAPSEQIDALTHALGVRGTSTKTESMWSIVDGDQRLDVQRVGGLPWSYSSADGGVSSSGAVVCGSPCPPDAQCLVADCPTQEPQRPADLPSKAEAQKLGRDLLAELDVDLAHATVQVEDGFSVWNVSADPEIDGVPVVGMATSIAIGPKGVVAYANGWLATPDKGDRYPLIGTAVALKQLNENQVRPMGGPQPMIAEVRPECDPAADCGIDPPPTEPTVVHITNVRLGLELFSTYEPGRPAYLVPAYLFMTEDGIELPVIAVDEKYLGQAPQPTPQPGDGTKGDPGPPVESPPGTIGPATSQTSETSAP